MPDELFHKIKDYLQRSNMTQKEFVIGLIENEIERDLTQRAAMSESPTASAEMVDEHSEQQETAALSDCESVSEKVGEQESTDFSDNFDSEREEEDQVLSRDVRQLPCGDSVHRSSGFGKADICKNAQRYCLNSGESDNINCKLRKISSSCAIVYKSQKI